MAIEILLPRLGWTMEEGTFVEWLKRDGDAVAPGEPLFTVESDKSLNEVESFDAGVLRIPADSPAQPGARLPVGAVLAYIVGLGEAMPTGDDGLTADRRPPTADDDRRWRIGTTTTDDDLEELRTDNGRRRSAVGGRNRHGYHRISPLE